MKIIHIAIIGVMFISGFAIFLLGQMLFTREIQFIQDPYADKSTAKDATLPECDFLDQFPASIQAYCPIIVTASTRTDLDPILISAVIYIESRGDPTAISKSGAVGLMQIMPSDGIAAGFICKYGPCFADRPSSEELTEPAYNVSYGSGLLADLILATGSVREGLKQYGPMNVEYTYADQVISTMEQYR